MLLIINKLGIIVKKITKVLEMKRYIKTFTFHWCLLKISLNRIWCTYTKTAVFTVLQAFRAAVGQCWTGALLWGTSVKAVLICWLFISQDEKYSCWGFMIVAWLLPASENSKAWRLQLRSVQGEYSRKL